MIKDFQWEIIEQGLLEPDMSSFLTKIHELAYGDLWSHLPPNSARVYVSMHTNSEIFRVALGKWRSFALDLMNYGFGGKEELTDNQMELVL